MKICFKDWSQSTTKQECCYPSSLELSSSQKWGARAIIQYIGENRNFHFSARHRKQAVSQLNQHETNSRQNKLDQQAHPYILVVFIFVSSTDNAFNVHLHVNSEVSDQSAHMSRLIRVYTYCIGHFPIGLCCIQAQKIYDVF